LSKVFATKALRRQGLEDFVLPCRPAGSFAFFVLVAIVKLPNRTQQAMTLRQAQASNAA